MTISNTITYSGTLSALGLSVLLPAGWSYASGSGSEGNGKPPVGTTSLLEWTWTTIPASPVTFSYKLNVPAGNAGTKSLSAIASLGQSGSSVQVLALPDPLSIAVVTFHSADTTGATVGSSPDSKINLPELLRVIELYNYRSGTVRTGQYTMQQGTEDGFAPGPNGSALTRYHSADTVGATVGTPPDGRIGLPELLRVIELYNYRASTVRTGEYHVQAGTEDGFAPGP